MLILCLILASLLLSTARRLESQIFSAERRVAFHQITLLEKQVVREVLMQITDPNFEFGLWRDVLVLNCGTPVNLNVRYHSPLLEVGYDFEWAGFLGTGQLIYNRELHAYEIR